MALQIKWTKGAEEKFLSIIAYVEMEWGTKSASDFVDESDDVIDLISAFPEIGNLEKKEKGIRSFLITKQTKLFYRIKGERLILLTFFDTRQNPKKKPK